MRLKLALARLGFAHRVLWTRDETYRIAFVLGPPILLGAILGGAGWLAWRQHSVGIAAAPWATPEPNGNMRQDGTPVAVAPDFPLPSPGRDGRLTGLEAGWIGKLAPARVRGFDVDILPANGRVRYRPSPGDIDISAIIAAAPSSGLFVGVQVGLLRVAQAGQYGLTLRLRRQSYQNADCIARLGVGTHRVLSQYEVGLIGDTDKMYDPVLFLLTPGLYKVATAFGCWQDGEMVGPGQLTLMVRHPDDRAPMPARKDDVLRPARPAN